MLVVLSLLNITCSSVPQDGALVACVAPWDTDHFCQEHLLPSPVPWSPLCPAATHFRNAGAVGISTRPRASTICVFRSYHFTLMQPYKMTVKHGVCKIGMRSDFYTFCVTALLRYNSYIM